MSGRKARRDSRAAVRRALRCGLLALLVASFPLLAGCWNYREVETLSIVAGIAVDQGSRAGTYAVTVEALDFSSGGTKNAEVKPLIVTSEGSSVFDAVRNAIKKSGQKLFFSHCKVVIISRELAAEGISPVLDWFSRDAEPRITLELVVSKGQTAGELLLQKPISGQIISLEIDKMLESDAISLAEAPNVKLYQASDILGAEGESLSLPAVTVSGSPKGDTPELAGAAIFRRDRLIGFLSSDEAKYLLLAQNKVSGGLLPLDKESGEPDVTLEILENHTKMIPSVAGGSPSIRLEIDMKAALAEMETEKDYENMAGLAAVEADAERELEDGMKALVARTETTYDSDIFGFGEKLHQYFPEYWKKSGKDWEARFRDLTVTVSARVQIENTATVGKRAKKEG